LNGPAALRAAIARAPNKPLVIVESTPGWYRAAGVLEAADPELHLSHPHGVLGGP
jgi:hypothetical protein